MKTTYNISTQMTRWVLCLAMTLLFWNAASAQTTVTIGSGTTTNSYFPIYTCYGYSYSQQIYTAAEMSAAGAINGGNITQVKFFYNSGGTTFSAWPSWTVYLGNTGQSELASTTGWISVANMTQVFSGNIPTPVAGTWLTLTLTTPFQWTGGNLVVAVDENTPGYSCTAAWRSFTATATTGTARRGIIYYSDGTNPNPATPPTANYSSTTTRAQIQMTMTGGAACSGTPTPGNTIASAANICTGSSVNLSLQNSTAGSGVSYQWQSGPSSSGPWTNFGGNFAGVSASPTSPTWYQCVVTCSGSSGTSNPVQVGINPFLSCYCASNATTTFDEAISNVTLGSLNNNSSCGVTAPGPGSIANQYSNFTTSVTAPTLFQGSSYPASVTQTSCGGAYSNKSRMWIDFNQSGTYDANELVVDGPYVLGNNTATATVTIPLNAVLGTTGMRVVNVESSTVNACGTYFYGETEDYLVTIAPSNNCSGAPTPGNTLSTLSAACYNSAQSFTLSLSNTPSSLGNSFVWQSAPSASGPWTNLGAGGSCSYTFRLTDSYGDGWNGATMELRQGATVVATFGPTFTSGTQLDIPVSLSASTSYSLVYTGGGSWASEVGIQIINESSSTIYNLGAGAGTVGSTLYSWTTNACGVVAQGPTYTISSQTVATWYRAEVTCTFSGQTAYSTPVLVGSVLCYCASSAIYTADDEIFNVSIGTLNNSSTCSTVAPGPGSLQNRYSNYSGFATVPDLGQGTSVPFSVTVGQCGSFAYSGYVRIYIDGNQDGDFADAGELVYTSPATTFQLAGTTLSGNVIIPNCATLGQTKMRVVAVESVLPSADGCGTYSWGETEDYDVNIVYTAPVPAVASNINGPATSSCNTTLAYSVDPGYSGSIQWQYSIDAVNYINITNATSVNQLLVANGPATFYLRVRFIGTGCTTDAVSNVITTVIAPPPITFATSSPSTDICRGTTVTLTANSSVAGPYSWSTTATTQSIDVTPLATTTYTVNVGSGLCIGTNSVTLNIIGGPVATSDLSPSAISCPGEPVNLTSQLIPGLPGGTYNGSSISYAPISISGTAGPTGDDVLGGPYTIPFNFTFYGNTYSNIYISTNGFASFAAGAGSGCCSGQLIPSATAPNNVIALAWDDLNNTTNGISYATVGTAPNRIFVIDFNNVPHFGGGGSNVTGQIHLYESTNVIEIHTGLMTNDGSNHTQGIENATGTLANAVPGRNSITWSGANDAYRFTPDPGVTFTYSGPVTYTWTGSNGFSANTQNATDNPTAPTTYTLTVADDLCSSSTTLNKDVHPQPSVFAFNGGPYCEGQNALFFGFGSSSATSSGTCNYTFRLTDSYGDGWNGATMQVRQGTTVIATLGSTFTNGSSLDVPVALNGATAFNLYYVGSGTYPSEVGIQILDQNNTVIYNLASGGGSVGTILYSWTTGTCGTGVAPINYAWSGPNGFTSTDQNPLIAGLTASNAGIYDVVITDANNCTASAIDFLTVNDNPDVDYTTFTNETCPGYFDGTMEIGISGGDGSYSISDGGLYSTFGSPAQFYGVGPGTYFFSISDGNLCGTTTSITVGVEPNIPPVLVDCPSDVNMNAAANACGAIVTFTPPTATDNCPWGLGNVIQTAGLPSGSLFPVGTTVNTFSVTDAEGATVTCSFSVTVSDINAPSITNVPANISSCNPVSWTVPTITDNCAGVQVTSTHVPGTNFPSGTTTVTYTATDVYGNTSSASFNVTVLEPSTAATSVSSNRDFNNICAGENITLTVNGGSLGEQASWKWYRTTCGGAANYVGQGTSVTVAPTATTTYYVRAEGLCNTTACQSITVTVSTGGPASAPTFSTLPTAAAPGVNSTVCVNPVPGATFYQWFTQNGHNQSILFNGQVGPIQTSTNCVNVSFVLPQQNYFIRVFAGNACGRTNQTNAAGIRGTVSASTCINGPTQVCPGQTLSYTACAIPSQTSVSYDWQIIPAVPGTATISFNGTNATVNYLPGFTTAQICVNGISTFGLAGPSYCINVSTNAPTPGAISGLVEPCEGSTQTYSIAAVPNATSYTWSSNIAGAVVTGNGTSATVVFPANVFAGDVCVVANSSCGTSAPSCLAVTSGQPGVPGAISGPVSGICNASNVNYSLATSNANSYNWIVPAGVTISGPSNLNAVNLNFGAGFTGGTVTVEAFYDCGSATSSITVDGAPDAPSLTPAVICPEASELYTASSTGATSYNWTLSGDDYSACTNPPTCSQYFVIWSVSGGSLSVTATNSCGTSTATAISGSSCRNEVGGLDSKVYPNPTNGKLFVEFRAQVAGEHNIFVTDLSGRIVFTTAIDANVGANLQEIDLSGANAGLYMVHVKDPKGTISINKVGLE